MSSFKAVEQSKKLSLVLEDSSLMATSEGASKEPGICPVIRVAGASGCQRCPVRTIGFCADLNDREIDDLSAVISRRSLVRNQPLIVEGDAVDDVYTVISGGLKLYKSLPNGRVQAVGFLGPGDFLGLACDEAFSFSADAIVDTEVCVFPRRVLLEIFHKHEELQDRVLRSVCKDLAAAREQILLIGTRKATERVGAFILKLLDRVERLDRQTDLLDIPFSREEIAEYLGLSIETVSRSFTELRTKGLIRMPTAQQVSVVDPPGLRKLALVD